MAKIIHDRKRCIRCGACASVCPEMFEMSEKDNMATLKNSKENNGVFELEVDEAGCAEQAASVCPLKIIEIESL
ncbi:MAG: ferredoxin [Candidatus Pacebacteria bacterium]|nr:ferredoxin [Candidatus Paceibacterota bacterium]